jgi:hypothetical protein
MFSRIRLIVVLLGATGVTAVAAPAAGAVAPPPNDASADATVVSALPFTDTLDTTEATIGPEDAAGSAACGLSAPLPKSVFYRYTAPVDQVVRIDVSQSTYAAAVGVLSGEPSACVTTFLGSGSLSAQAGRSYLIAVVDFGAGEGGTLRLSISVLVPPREPVVRLLGSGTVHRATHAVTVPVKYRCDGGPFALLGVQVTQRRGRRTAEGFGSEFSPLCDGMRHVAKVVLFTAPGSVFKPGRAVATATISQFVDPFGEFMSQDGPQPICLRPMGRRIVAP